VAGRILIGLDAPAHVAVLTELGIRFARRLGDTLVGLAIVDEPGIRAIEPEKPVGGTPGVDPVYYVGYRARLADVQRQAEELLNDFAERCARAGVAHAQVKAVGLPYERIACEAQSCELVLLSRGFHFHFTAQDHHAQESLRKVMKDTARPVVVAPPVLCPDGPILIAYDGSVHAERALAAFAATRLGESGEVHIISVAEEVGVAAQHAEAGRRFLAQHRIKAVMHPIESPASAEQVILEQVRWLGAGLLVMGAYGRPVVREFFLGSATRSLLREAPVPLLLCH
jgi:nucleotide-binding universal stress UspA family protein